MSWIQTIKNKLVQTSTNFTKNITKIFNTGKKVDAETLEQFEDLLLMSDMGPEIAADFVNKLKETKFDEIVTTEYIQHFLQVNIANLLESVSKPLDIEKHNAKPTVIILCGVNGNGKTTTAGKLGMQFKQQGKSIMFGACDTFRAAAVEQLQEWGNRVNAEVIIGETNQDPASVAYTALVKAQNAAVDILILDTAGRLHNKTNLMDELQKCTKVLKKLDVKAPHEIIMVVDSTTGQNAYTQIETFNDKVPISGLIFTKLDSTAKGGIIVGVAKKYAIPIYAIGVGEGIDDLKAFDPYELAKAIV